MKALLITIGILITFSLAAQDSVYRYDADRFVDATFHTYARPLHWKRTQWLTFGGILAGSAAVSLLDKPVQKLFVRTEAHFPDLVETIGYHYGKPYSAFIVTGGFYLVGFILNDRWAKDTGLNLGVTLLTSGLLQTALKDVAGRARPGAGAGPYSFHIPARGDIAYHSFPSGHSAVAFGITLVLARRIESKPVKVLLYALAASTVLSRLHVDAHWLSDVAFGAALAWACDETVRKRLSFNRRPKQSHKISWMAAPAINGLSVIGKF